MIDIKQKIEQLKAIKYDISGHMDTLIKYGRQCEHITEFGVYLGWSLWAWAASAPGTLRAYDIQDNPYFSTNGVAQYCDEIGKDFEFHVQDVVAKGFKIDETDLLFIDTLHTYKQLSTELKMHGNKARKYIIMHDTVTFGRIDQQLTPRKGPAPKKQGLTLAITEFLQANKHWRVAAFYENDNGLTVLERV